MSALSDPRNVDLTRDVERDGDVRRDPLWQELTGGRYPAPADDAESEEQQR